MKSKIILFMYVLFSFTTCMSMSVKDREEEARPFIADSSQDLSEADANASQSSSVEAMAADVASDTTVKKNFKIAGVEIPGGVVGAVSFLLGGSALVGGAIVGATIGTRKVMEWRSERQEINQLKNDICKDTSENGSDPVWRKDLANLVAQVAETFPIVFDIWKHNQLMIIHDPFHLYSQKIFIDILDDTQRAQLYDIFEEHADSDFTEDLRHIVHKPEQVHLLVLAEDNPRLFEEERYLDQLDEIQQRGIKNLYRKQKVRIEALDTARKRLVDGEVSSDDITDGDSARETYVATRSDTQGEPRTIFTSSDDA